MNKAPVALDVVARVPADAVESAACLVVLPDVALSRFLPDAMPWLPVKAFRSFDGVCR